MMKNFLLFFALILTLTGCNRSNNEEPVVRYTTLVTYAGTDKDTQVSTFTYQAIDDSPLITLTANWLPAEGQVKQGERVLIVYNTDNYGANGPVQLLQVAPVIGWTPSTTDAPVSGNIGLQPVSVWRSGPYFNANVEAYIGSKGTTTAKFALLSSTKNDPTPVYYLAINQNDFNSIEAYRKIAIISYDISEVWNLPSCQSVKVIYRDYQNQEAEITITK